MTERRFRRELHSLEPIVEFVNEFLTARGIGADQGYDVHLIIEELFTNMLRYSRESDQDIAIGLEWTAPVLIVRMRDFDVEPFDVTQPPPASPRAADGSGGRGLQFVQRVADALEYRWADRVSTITVTKRLSV